MSTMDPITLRPHWTLDRRVSLSHIIATVSFIAAAVAIGNKMDSRVTVLETRQAEMMQARLQDRQELLDQLRQVNAQLDRLDEDLHHLEEHSHGHD